MSKLTASEGGDASAAAAALVAGPSTAEEELQGDAGVAAEPQLADLVSVDSHVDPAIAAQRRQPAAKRRNEAAAAAVAAAAAAADALVPDEPRPKRMIAGLDIDDFLLLSQARRRGLGVRTSQMCNLPP